MSLVGILIDGELRLYVTAGDKLGEYGRLAIDRTATHEELARFASDLLAFTRTEHEELAPEPEPERKPRALPMANMRARQNSVSYRIARAIEEHGPLTIEQAATITHASHSQARGALSSLVQRRIVRYTPEGYVLLKRPPPPINEIEPPSASASPRPRRADKPAGRENVPWRVLVLDEIKAADHPPTVIEIAERLGIGGARNPLSSALTALVIDGEIEKVATGARTANNAPMSAYRLVGGQEVRQEGESAPGFAEALALSPDDLRKLDEAFAPSEAAAP